MMGLDAPETCRSWRNVLRICCASSWFFFTRLYRDSGEQNIKKNTEFVLCLFKEESWLFWLLYFANYSWAVISGGFEGLFWTKTVSGAQFLTRCHLLEHRSITHPTFKTLANLSCRNSMGRVRSRPTFQFFFMYRYSLIILIKELLVSDLSGRLLEISAASGWTVTLI